MGQTFTAGQFQRKRVLSFIAGLGMAAASLLTIRHFFLANYPKSIFEGSFCDISAFFNCDGSAFSAVSQILGIPIGFFGLIVGILVLLGALFPSETFERTNAFISWMNMLGVLGLFLYSIAVLGSLCLFCTGYYIFSLLSFIYFWKYGFGKEHNGLLGRWFQPSIKILSAAVVIVALAGYGMIQFHEAQKEVQSATSVRIVKQFYELPVVGNPSFISPYWTVRSFQNFEDAPIQVIEYSDFLCPDCLFLAQQLNRLKEEFAGKINVAFQFFPLEGDCNTVVAKNIHSGACELAYTAAADPALFPAIHDEIFAHFNTARKNPEWRHDLAVRYGVLESAADPAVKAMVRTIINTGREYAKTSDRYAHGIRSTPTMIINGRMVIGTLPLMQMRAIFQALVDEREGGKRFLENWVPPKARKIRR